MIDWLIDWVDHSGRVHRKSNQTNQHSIAAKGRLIMPVVLESNVYLQRNDTSRNILALLQTLLGVRVVPLAIQKRLIVCATLGSNVLGGRHQDGRSGDGRIHRIFPHRCSCCSCCNCRSLFVCRSLHLLPSCFSSLRLSCLFASVLSSLGFLSLAQLAMANLPYHRGYYLHSPAFHPLA